MIHDHDAHLQETKIDLYNEKLVHSRPLEIWEQWVIWLKLSPFWAAKKKTKSDQLGMSRKVTNWVCPAPIFYSKNLEFVARKEGAILQFQLTWLTWPVCRIVSRLEKLHLDQVFLLGVMVDQNPFTGYPLVN